MTTSQLSPAHRSHPGTPPPATLELFYDLIFVAAIVVLSDSFSHSPTAEDFGWLAIVFALIWLVWMQTSLLFNLSDSDSTAIRFMVLAQMMLLVLAAVSASDGVSDHADNVGPIYAGILVLLAVMHWYCERGDPELRGYVRGRVVSCAVGAVVFVLTPLYPDPGYLVFWTVGFLVVLAPSLRPDPMGGRAIDREHLVERFGAFTIIMLGESFVKTALTATVGQMEGLDLICLTGTFLIVFAIWWLYFAHVPEAGPPAGRRGHIAWMMVHLPLHLCIVGLAVGAAKAISQTGHDLQPQVIPYLSMPLVGVLACLAGLELLSGHGRTTKVAALYGIVAAFVLVAGSLVAVFDPEGIESTSLVLAGVMVTTVVCVRQLRVAGLRAHELRADDDEGR
ncbi:MAG: low temperature requirement protein A [Microthrixaceae bacterium]